MSFIPCITLANLTTPVTLLGGGGTAPSTINTQNLNASTISLFPPVTDPFGAKMYLNPYDAYYSIFSTNLSPVARFGAHTDKSNNTKVVIQGDGTQTGFLDLTDFLTIDSNNADLFASTVTTTGIFLDAQTLTANATELLLNGIPVATTSNISSLADWSLYPMVSTLDGANQKIKNLNDIQSFTGNFGSIFATTLTVNTVVAQSTVNNYSTINTVDIEATTINTVTLSTNTMATNAVNLRGPNIAAIFYENLNVAIQQENISTASGIISSIVVEEQANGDSGSFAANPLYLLPPALGGGILAGQSYTLSNTGSNITSDAPFVAPSIATQQLIAFNSIVASNATFTGSIGVTGTVTGGTLTTAGTVYGGAGSFQGALGTNGDIGAGGKITANDLLRGNKGINVANGGISLIGGLGDAAILATDNNATGVRFQAGVGLITTAAALSMNVGGAANWAVGGALSLSGGGVIELNTGYVSFSGGSTAHVNRIETYNSGSIAVNSPLFANSNIATPALAVNQIYSLVGPVSIAGIKQVSTIKDLSTINGLPIASYLVSDAPVFSSITVSSINNQQTTEYLTFSTTNATFFSTLTSEQLIVNQGTIPNLLASSINGIPLVEFSNISTFSTATVSSLLTTNINTTDFSTITANISTANVYNLNAFYLNGTPVGLIDLTNITCSSLVADLSARVNGNMIVRSTLTTNLLTAVSSLTAPLITATTARITNLFSPSANISTLTGSAATLSSINGVAVSQYLNTSTFSGASISSLSVSSINNLGVSSFLTPSAFNSTVIGRNLSTTAIPIASTFITMNSPGYVLAQMNVSASNATNQYRNTYINLKISSIVSHSTFTSLPAGTGHQTNGSLSFRTLLGPGTWPIVAFMSAETNGDGFVTSVSLSALGNLV